MLDNLKPGALSVLLVGMDVELKTMDLELKTS